MQTSKVAAQNERRRDRGCHDGRRRIDVRGGSHAQFIVRDKGCPLLTCGANIAKRLNCRFRTGVHGCRVSVIQLSIRCISIRDPASDVHQRVARKELARGAVNWISA